MPEGTPERSKRQAFLGHKHAIFLIFWAFVVSWKGIKEEALWHRAPSLRGSMEGTLFFSYISFLSMIQNIDEQVIRHRRRRRRVYIVIGIVLIFFVFLPVGVLSFLTVKYYKQIQSGEIVSPEERRLKASISSIAANAHPTKEDRERLIPAGNFPELGDKDAQITVVEFLDFACPYSKDSAGPIRRLMEKMGDRVRFIIRDFPIVELHEHARDAALAANCALEQGMPAYWRYHDLLFGNQDELTNADLLSYASTANINVARFEQCMKDRKYDLAIDQSIEIGRKAGVEGTPTFFVNGAKFQGVVDESVLEGILQYYVEQLGEKSE